jgi:hypothetical protein
MKNHGDYTEALRRVETWLGKNDEGRGSQT